MNSTNQKNISSKSLSKAVGMRSDYCGQISSHDIGRQVSVCGWVGRRREHGEHLVFIDLRDHTGIIQCVVQGTHGLHSEYVVKITGTVSPRPEGTSNKDLATGEVEITNCEVEVLSKADSPPFSISDRIEVEENVRLRYRYLDLRRNKMQHHLRMRAKVNSLLRHSFESQGFTEVETPLLWTPTPEGAREFVVPSRMKPGSFYVLPQSPQIAKQLLMVGGLDRYYQIARCLRDEDLRADRQFEFTQLDIEASFVTQQDILDFVTQAVIDVVSEITGISIESIPILTWEQSMELYGTDKPDLRFDMQIVDLTAIFKDTQIKAFQANSIKGIKVPSSCPLSRSKLDNLVAKAKEMGAKGLAWFKAVDSEDGVVLESPLAKHLGELESKALIEAFGIEPLETILIVADEISLTRNILGNLRNELGEPDPEKPSLCFAWVVDFPLFEGFDEDGNLISGHHPFTMPNLEDFHLIDSDPLSVRSQSYDLVLNGWELGSGSIRIHRDDIQSKIFSVLGISSEQAQERFGFLLSAFSFGAPPHGGFALGLDRTIALLAGEDNIREVIAFPKTSSGFDPMTQAPKPISPQQLKLLSLVPIKDEALD